MKGPAVTYDPVSWLVLADWMEEFEEQPRGSLVARIWRWRAELARLLDVRKDLTCAWVPCFRGMVRVQPNGPDSALCVWVVEHPRTLRVSVTLTQNEAIQMGYIWMRGPKDRSRYYRRRLWQLADCLRQFRGVSVSG